MSVTYYSDFDDAKEFKGFSAEEKQSYIDNECYPILNNGANAFTASISSTISCIVLSVLVTVIVASGSYNNYILIGCAVFWLALCIWKTVEKAKYEKQEETCIPLREKARGPPVN